MAFWLLPRILTYGSKFVAKNTQILQCALLISAHALYIEHVWEVVDHHFVHSVSTQDKLAARTLDQTRAPLHVAIKEFGHAFFLFSVLVGDLLDVLWQLWQVLNVEEIDLADACGDQETLNGSCFAFDVYFGHS